MTDEQQKQEHRLMRELGDAVHLAGRCGLPAWGSERGYFCGCGWVQKPDSERSMFGEQFTKRLVDARVPISVQDTLIVLRLAREEAGK